MFKKIKEEMISPIITCDMSSDFATRDLTPFFQDFGVIFASA